ncbi:DNA polymerase III subunit gamma and tau, partial [Streptomyces sp. NPDC001719]
LQVGFANAGARDSFANSGSEEVLRQAITDALNVQWKVELVVSPGGGGGGAAPVVNYAGTHGSGGGQGGPAAAPQGSPGFAPRPAQAPAAPPAQEQRQGPPPAAPAHREPEPPPVALEDDMPEEDDPDLVDSALTGHDLIVRELGATVIEEIANE